MRKVVDSNYLQSPRLRDYLASTPKNEAVITDYAAMEAYKGDTLNSIYRSTEILAEFPRQVIILQPTSTAARLRGRRAGLQRRMIDDEQTRAFPVWCRKLAKARAGDQKLQRQLLDLGKEASDHMGVLLRDAETFSDNLKEAAKAFTAEELAILKRRTAFTAEMTGKLVKNTMNLAANLFAGHPTVQQLPSATEVPNTFIFRFAICGYLLALRWLAAGGAQGAKPQRIRNDIVDCNFAAYATFFDGLLSADAMALEIHANAKFLLKCFLNYAPKDQS